VKDSPIIETKIKRGAFRHLRSRMSIQLIA
jgi:hypothetical protein